MGALLDTYIVLTVPTNIHKQFNMVAAVPVLVGATAVDGMEATVVDS